MTKRTAVKKNHFSLHYIGILLVPLLLTLFIVFVLATQIQQQFDSRSSAQFAPSFTCKVTLAKAELKYACKSGYKVITYVCSNGAKGTYGSSTSSCFSKDELNDVATKACQSKSTCFSSASPKMTSTPNLPPGYTPPPSQSPRPTPTSFPPPTSTPRITSVPTPTPTAYPLRTPTPTPKVTSASSTPFPPPTSTPKPF